MLKMTDLKLDAIIAASVLQACAQLGSLNYGEMIHGYVVRMGPVVGLEAETSLVDMYAKCGSLNAAQRVFGEMRNWNMITWSALISGYGCHGFGSKALDLFEQMKRDGFIPDEAAFLSVLSACSHSGLVDEAWDMIKGMPFEPDTNIWRSLLSACKIKGNVKVAEYACNQLMELDYDNTDYHQSKTLVIPLVHIFMGAENSVPLRLHCTIYEQMRFSKRRYDAVMQSWQLAFSWGQGVAFQVQNLRARLLTDMAWLTMKTYVDMETEPFHVTNVYEFHNEQWFLVHHHNSLMLIDAELQNQNGFG
ncbi:hypothetical protein IFM89_034271 [Coptis chinensis]|uniref:SnoaL-like domain-containing protein n=1 Tax=Coptis chinensis TaxID=261450 RepID=A0A835H9X5_9MAGN|nr:hypothetical protein IFM89_034271 [Coptis chinensis]